MEPNHLQVPSYKPNGDQMAQGLTGLHDASHLRSLYQSIKTDYAQKMPVVNRPKNDYVDRAHLFSDISRTVGSYGRGILHKETPRAELLRPRGVEYGAKPLLTASYSPNSLLGSSYQANPVQYGNRSYMS